MKKLIGILFLIIGCIGLISCGTSTDEHSQHATRTIEFGQDDYKNLVKSHNQFGFNLFSDLKQQKDDNIFFSPTSMMIALSMVLNGAQDLTKDEMMDVLMIEHMDENELNRAIASLMAMLHKETDDIVLQLANSIWLHDTFHFQETFNKQMNDYFNAHKQSLNLLDDKSAKQINHWVKQATNDQIEDIVEPPIDPDMVMILINAIYFNGVWTYEFNEELTKDGAFHVSDSEVVTIPFMELSEDLAYMENEHMQVVSLPYGNDEMSMHIILPHEQIDIDQFHTLLTYEHWLNWKDTLRKREGTIRLPTFNIASDIELNDSLKSLGITTAFDPDQADFSLMIQEDDPLWISRIKHKAVLDVNEQGTEAAGATSIEMKTTSAPLEAPFFMQVDRPFFLLITDEYTDTILFIGWISNPT